MRRLPTLLALVLAVLLTPAAWAQGMLEVRFFDVGQGDAALLRSPTGKTVLIDAGPPEAGPQLARKLATLVKGPIDLVILSHPHLDHLGGMAAVIRVVGARRFIDSGFDHPSQAYAELLHLVGQRVGSAWVPAPDPERASEPLTIGLGGGAELKVLWPRAPQEPLLTGTRSDANANSIVARVTFGKTAFLFTGDAEAETERRLLERWPELTADVLKVPHHGGRYSTGAALLERIKPRFAVISCAARNDYGHPSQETLLRLEGAGAQVLRTDQQGDLIARSDGVTVTALPLRDDRPRPWRDGGEAAGAGTDGGPSAEPLLPAEPPAAAGRPVARAAATNPDSGVPGAVPRYPYAASRRAKVFHTATCPAVLRVRVENRLDFASRAEAARDREPAKDCHP